MMYSVICLCWFTDKIMVELDRYIETHSQPEDTLLAELDRETGLHVVQSKMLSGHVQGKFLEMLTRMIRPHTILEIGTYTGYSALCFASGSDADAVIDTIEKEDELHDFTASFFARSPYGYKIRQHTGSALDIAPLLGRQYDLVFIDGDKREYPDYYRMLMGDSPFTKRGALVKSGSYILADNILWYGKVTEMVKSSDRQTCGIKEFNDMIVSDGRVENVIIPLRDGLNLIRVL